ncbi:hypothetical protein ADK38_33175, partial [Streptomyces varsoviensis]
TWETLLAGLGAVLDTHDILRARTAPGGTGTALTVPEPGSVAAAAILTRVDAAQVPDEGLDEAAERAAHEAVERLP